MLKISRVLAEGIDMVLDVTYVKADDISSVRLYCQPENKDSPGSEAIGGQAELTLKNGNILTFDLDDEETIISCPSPDGHFLQIKTIHDLENFLLSQM